MLADFSFLRFKIIRSSSFEKIIYKILYKSPDNVKNDVIIF